MINKTIDDSRSLFITMPFIHQIALLYFAKLMYADYVVMFSIKMPCFLPKILKIRAAFLKLLAEMRGPVYLADPVEHLVFINFLAASNA